MFLKKILLAKLFSKIADFFLEFPEGDLSSGTVFWVWEGLGAEISTECLNGDPSLPLNAPPLVKPDPVPKAPGSFEHLTNRIIDFP